MEKKKADRFYNRNDIILIISLLLICSVALIYLFVFRKGGDTVRVTVDGEIYGIYSLSVDMSENIITEKDAECFNRLIISEGKAYIEEASCPDGICVAHRPVFRDGESIVCLPNRVVVTVVTDYGTDSPDVVV